MSRTRQRLIVRLALGLLSMTALAGCGSHATTAQSHDQDRVNYQYRFDAPATTTCSRIVEFAIDNSSVSNVGDCAGHLNTRPALIVQLNVGQHLYLYVAHDAQGQLSTPAASRPTVLRLIHHSTDTIAYTATDAGHTSLITHSKMCTDIQGNTVKSCTLLQVQIAAKN